MLSKCGNKKQPYINSKNYERSISFWYSFPAHFKPVVWSTQECAHETGRYSIKLLPEERGNKQTHSKQ